jgi:hypothetical protein
MHQQKHEYKIILFLLLVQYQYKRILLDGSDPDIQCCLHAKHPVTLTTTDAKIPGKIPGGFCQKILLSFNYHGCLREGLEVGELLDGGGPGEEHLVKHSCCSKT